MEHRQGPNMPGDGAGPWLTRDRTLELVFLAVTGVAIYLCYGLVRPFIAPIAWALALAVAVVPFHRRLERRLRRPGLAAGITVTLVGIVIVGPAVLATQQLVKQLAAAIEVFREATASGALRAALESVPAIGRIVEWIEANVRFDDQMQLLAGDLAPRVSSLVTGSVWVVFELGVTLFTLFFLLRDRCEARERLYTLVPLTRAETDRLLVRVHDTVHGTIFGSLTVAAVQGTLGGLMFWILGLPAPLLWGAIMALLGLIPMAGAFVVWLPAAVWLALQGSWGKAIVLAAWGATAVSLIDNLLYPMLVGTEGRMHTALVFFAVLGGVLVFGASGIVLGPVILAVTIGLLDVWHRRLAAPAAAPPAAALAPAGRLDDEPDFS